MDRIRIAIVLMCLWTIGLMGCLMAYKSSGVKQQTSAGEAPAAASESPAPAPAPGPVIGEPILKPAP